MDQSDIKEPQICLNFNLPFAVGVHKLYLKVLWP